MYNNPKDVAPAAVAWKIGQILFPVCAGLGAFLLFLVQPLAGKALLPNFGSSSAAWGTCLLYFQSVLVIGYAYAYGLGHLRPDQQVKCHMVLMLCAMTLSLGLYQYTGGEPLSLMGEGGESLSPLLSIVFRLLVATGPLCLLLSSNSVVVQLWYTRRTSGREPYHLYRWSNLGSLVALLGYPLLLETTSGLRTQWAIWLAGFGLLLVLMGLVSKPDKQGVEQAAKGSSSRVARDVASYQKIISWLWMACAGSLILNSGSNQMSADIGPVPMLWVLGLAAYLVSYVVAFSERSLISERLYRILAVAGVFCGAFLFTKQDTIGIVFKIILYIFIIFTICLFCHAKLYESRPKVTGMPAFYLCIAVGGAVGSVVINVGMPLLTRQDLDFLLSILIISIHLLYPLWTDYRERRRVLACACIAGLLIASIFIAKEARERSQSALWSARNFYGTVAVRQELSKISSSGQDVKMNSLFHGRIAHGAQVDLAPWRFKGTTYYGAGSGLDYAIQALRRNSRGTPLNMGVIGLGVGTIAVYGEESDLIVFYELNPRVIEIATNGEYFSYISDSRANINIVEGDGRLSLDMRSGSGEPEKYDLIVVDAFNGDAIPVHLLTREALDIYRSRLSTSGLLAFHISSRYIDLAPVVHALASDAGMYASFVTHSGNHQTTANSLWAMVSSKADLVPEAEQISQMDEFKAVAPARVWTDNRQNVYPYILRRLQQN